MMAGKTNAQRQADYRARRSTAGGQGERHLSAWIDTGAALALERLARRAGTSQKAVLEALIAEADAEVCRGLDPDGDDWREYFGVVTR